MPKRLDQPATVSPDYFNQGRVAEKSSAPERTGPVDHYEIGEAAHFLKPYGRTYRDALQNLITGSIQIVGLDDVKAQYADQWETIEKSVLRITEAFLARRLGKQDVYVPLDAGHFALLFADLSREDAVAKSREIASDLVNKLFGEMPGGELISVEAAMLEIEDFDGLDRIESLDDLIHCFRTAIEKTQDAETRDFQKRRQEIGVRFRPFINRRKNFMAMNEVLAYDLTDGEAKPLTSDDPVFNGTPRLRAEMDFVILREVGKHIEELGDAGNKPTIFLSVHFETLANAFCRGKYARILSALPLYTSRHLILNIQGTVTGTPNSRYRQIFTSIRSLVLGFTFEVNPDWKEFDSIRDLPVHAITVAEQGQQSLPEITRLIGLAKGNKKKVVWRSLGDDALVRAAFDAGMDYVSGPVFSTIQPTPFRPFSIRP